MSQNKPGPNDSTTHPRNRYQGHYDIKSLLKTDADLAPFASHNLRGEPSINFADPNAVKALNRALLKQYYDITGWDIPDQYLCPPIPGRADYIHHLADLLAVNVRAQTESWSKRKNVEIRHGLPCGPGVRVLDVGVGANCIYPIVGHCEYGWTFVGSDIDVGALQNAEKILSQNPKLEAAVTLRKQETPADGKVGDILKGVIQPGEFFDLTMCNPPFHTSAFEAAEVNERKWRNLGKAPVANFGGLNHELWVEGGEVAFIKRMISESATMPKNALWFTSFVSKEASLKPIYEFLTEARALEYRVFDMLQGQKRSRFIAWTFIGGKKTPA